MVVAELEEPEGQAIVKLGVQVQFTGKTGVLTKLIAENNLDSNGFSKSVHLARTDVPGPGPSFRREPR